jgi:hypothetical protein
MEQVKDHAWRMVRRSVLQRKKGDAQIQTKVRLETVVGKKSNSEIVGIRGGWAPLRPHSQPCLRVMRIAEFVVEGMLADAEAARVVPEAAAVGFKSRRANVLHKLCTFIYVHYSMHCPYSS